MTGIGKCVTGVLAAVALGWVLLELTADPGRARQQAAAGEAQEQLAVLEPEASLLADGNTQREVLSPSKPSSNPKLAQPPAPAWATEER